MRSLNASCLPYLYSRITNATIQVLAALSICLFVCFSGDLIPSLSLCWLMIFRIKVGTMSRSLLQDLDSNLRDGPTKNFFSQSQNPRWLPVAILKFYIFYVGAIQSHTPTCYISFLVRMNPSNPFLTSILFQNGFSAQNPRWLPVAILNFYIFM